MTLDEYIQNKFNRFETLKNIGKNKKKKNQSTILMK